MHVVPNEVKDLAERWAAEVPGTVLLWGLTDLHAAGLAGERSSRRGLGLHVGRSSRLLGLDPPPELRSFDGYAAGADFLLESVEVGAFLRRLRDGDRDAICLPYSPQPLVPSDLHGQLLEQARFSLHSGLTGPWADANQVLWSKAKNDGQRRSVAHRALMDAHTLRTGEVVWDHREISSALGLPDMSEGNVDELWSTAQSLLDQVDAVSPLPARAEYADLEGFLQFARDSLG